MSKVINSIVLVYILLLCSQTGNAQLLKDVDVRLYTGLAHNMVNKIYLDNSFSTKEVEIKGDFSNISGVQAGLPLKNNWSLQASISYIRQKYQSAVYRTVPDNYRFVSEYKTTIYNANIAAALQYACLINENEKPWAVSFSLGPMVSIRKGSGYTMASHFENISPHTTILSVSDHNELWDTVSPGAFSFQAGVNVHPGINSRLLLSLLYNHQLTANENYRYITEINYRQDGATGVETQYSRGIIGYEAGFLCVALNYFFIKPVYTFKKDKSRIANPRYPGN